MTTLQIDKLLSTFQKYLEKNGKHENTVRSYTNDAGKFLRWMRSTIGEGFHLSEITKADITDFRGFLLTRKASPTSVNRRITAVRQFFEFCHTEGIILANPAHDISGLPMEPSAPVLLTRKDALLLIRTAESKRYPLDSCVILLLLHGGLRSAEICSLTCGDLHLTPREGKIFIRGQRGRMTRFVYLTTRTQAALKQYFKRRGINILARMRREETLFIQMDGSELTQMSIDTIVKRTGREVGMPNVNPTILRNTFAVHALLNGDSQEALSRMLGVSSVRNLQKVVEKLKEQGQSL